MSIRLAVLFCLALLVCLMTAAQADDRINAGNLANLKPAARIDFADIAADMRIGFFAANHDGGEFIVFDQAGTLYRISPAGLLDSWTYRERESQLFSLIDAVYLNGEAFALYLLDSAFYINDMPLALDGSPLALGALEDSLVIEYMTDGGEAFFQALRLDESNGAFQLAASLPMPDNDSDAPAVRVGRIDLPNLIVSDLAANELAVYRFPHAFTVEAGALFTVAGGPAVVGAVNAAATHFAWSGPAAERLNLLDFASGENVIVAELGGAYAQYHLLTDDASAILVVNLDFAPRVYAWDVATGKRHDLGAYRDCARIPDKVALSRDSRSLIIGCDTGLDIWRVAHDAEN